MSPREGPLPPAALREAWTRLHAAGRRAREAAAELGVSEAELVAATCTVDDGPLRATALDVGDVNALSAALATLGVVKTQTRSGGVVLEVVGPYSQAAVTARPEHWASCFVVREGAPRSHRASLQVFDTTGAPIHKIFLVRESDTDAFERLARARPIPVEAARVGRPNMQREAGPARSGEPASVPRLLRRLAADSTPFTISVKNLGAVHTHLVTPRRSSSKNDWVTVVSRDAKVLVQRETRGIVRRHEGTTHTVELWDDGAHDATLTGIPRGLLGPEA